MQLITDFAIATITLSREQFFALPARVQSLLKLYGTECRLHGYNGPSTIEIRRYRIPELEEAMTAANCNDTKLF